MAITHDLDKISDFFIAAFPKMDHTEQVLARTVYQQLSLGEPLHQEHLAELLEQAPDTVREKLKKWGSVFYNEANDIIGFLGITVNETPHHMLMNEKKCYAWCAWDTLFIPELIGATVQITSVCATTNEIIILTVSPQSIHPTQTDIWVSFLLPDKKSVQENVSTSFCHFVHFFNSKEAGETWTNQHNNIFLLSLNEAFEVGKKVNAARFSTVLS